jgi:hypothetical protein
LVIEAAHNHVLFDMGRELRNALDNSCYRSLLGVGNLASRRIINSTALSIDSP